MFYIYLNMKQIIACFLLALLLFQCKKISGNSGIGLFDPLIEIISASEDLLENSGNNLSPEYLDEHSPHHPYNPATYIDFYTIRFPGMPISGVKKIDLPPPELHNI